MKLNRNLSPRSTILLLDSNCPVTRKGRDYKKGKMLGKLGQIVPLFSWVSNDQSGPNGVADFVKSQLLGPICTGLNC